MPEGTFSSRLTEQRKQKGVSQKQASKDLGISQALLSHYERGIRECGLDFVVRAADYYGVSCDYLLGHTNNSLQLETIPKIFDIPEDADMSPTTIFRATLSIFRSVQKDVELLSFTLRCYALATYMMLSGAAKRGVLPGTWLQPLSVNDEQFKFLVRSMTNSLDELPARDRRPKRTAAPASVTTLCSWMNDYLNEKIADLL